MAIVGRTETRLRRAVNELGGGDRLLAELADVSDSLQVDTFVQRITDLWGGIDVLVNNAGTNIKERTIRELNPKRWQVLMRSNLDGTFNCIHAVLPQMLQRKDGVIVNICSVAGLRAGPLGEPVTPRPSMESMPWGSAWPLRNGTAAFASALSTPARWILQSWTFGRKRSPTSSARRCSSRKTWPPLCSL